MSPTSRRRRLAALVVAAALTGCSSPEVVPVTASSPVPSAAPSPSPSPSPTPAPSPPSPPPAPLLVDPLTGLLPVPTGSVVAVKIDNSPLARRYHRGLDEAALVYQELVEGGATRFLAVYAPATRSEVGPIRSIRESDLELLTQFGRIPIGASGANEGVLATVARAEVAGEVIDVNFESVPEPYRKGERRKDAFNFFASPAGIDRARPGGEGPRDIGLTFGTLPANTGVPARRAEVRFSPISDVSVRYEPSSGRYAVHSEGDRLNDAAPANVVVQYVKIVETAYTDVLGNHTPYTVTTGGGPAVVLRDGRMLTATWSRPDRHAGTRLVDEDGEDVPLRPGPTWFLLVPEGRAVRAS